MRMLQWVYEDLIAQLPKKPPEIGGILGGKDGVVTEYIFDNIILNGKANGCSYMPDVKFLNDRIQKWIEREINFMGIFHTHFGGNTRLSQGDKEYIKVIMNAMPNNINILWFPIAVLPERELVPYKAEGSEECIKISKEYMKLEVKKDVNHL